MIAPRKLAPLTLLVVGTLCSACSHPLHAPASPAPNTSALAGEVTGKAIEPNSEDRYEVDAADPSYYEQPTDYFDNPPPSYPSSLLAQRLPPAQLRVRVVVDERGRVTGVTSLDQSGADSNRQAFLASVQSTVAGWRYLPLVKVTPGEEQTTLTDAFGGGLMFMYPGKAIPLPFHKDYEFTFRQVDGRASVEVRKEPGRSS